MRPVRLTIEGLRSFRSEVSIDFTDRDHVAVVGDTGAGKSSILEAITYALYGRPMFTAQGNQELMNDTSMHLRVVLRFEVSGKTWEVARTLKRDGHRKVGAPSAQLCLLGDRDAAVRQIEKVGPVNEHVKKLIGLDSDAFLCTVVLPQGRFARLLAGAAPAERVAILRQVWRTDELEAAGAMAGAARQQVTVLRVKLEEQVSQYPEDPAAYLEQLSADLDHARERARAASATADRAEAALKTFRDSNRERTAAADVVDRLHAPAIGQAVTQLKEIAARESEIAAQDGAIVRQQAEIATRLAEIPHDTDGPGVPDVAAALATLRAIAPQVTAAETAAEEARRSADAAARVTERATRTSELAAAAGERTARHAKLRPSLVAAFEGARDRRATIEQRYADCVAYRTALNDAQDALAVRRNERAASSTALEAAKTAADHAGTTATAANERLRAARLASAENATAYAQQQQQLLEARAAADKHRLTVERQHDECLARANEANEAKQRLAKHREQQDALTQQLEATKAEAREFKRRQQEADKRLEAVRRSDSAAAAARDLHVGDACPVCRRELPTGWALPDTAGLQEAISAAELAGRAADEVGRRMAALDAKGTSGKQQLDTAVIRAHDTSEAFRTALKVLGENVGGDLHGALPDGETLLGPLDKKLQDTSNALDRAESDHAARVKTLAGREQQARADSEAAQRAFVAAGQRVAALTAALQGLERQIGEAKKNEGTAAAALAAAFQALGEAAATTLTDTLPDRSGLLGSFNAAVETASDALERHDDEHRKLLKESNKTSTAAAAAAAAADGADSLAGAKRKAAADALAQVHQSIQAVPVTFRPGLDLPADPAGLQKVDTTAVGERMAAAKARQHLLTERAIRREQLRKEIAAARDKRETLAGLKASEVDAPIKGIAGNLNEHRSVLLKAVWGLHLDEDVPVMVDPEDTGALLGRIEALRAATANVGSAAEAQAKDARCRAGEARTALLEIAAHLADDIASGDLDAIVEAARTAALHAGFDKREAEKDRRQFRRIVDDVQRLRDLLDKVAGKERALTDLENALKPGAFPKWLTMRRSKDLLVHASRILATMSGGRYKFVDPQDTDAQWRVLDRDSGQGRSPASLSGGEQFIASLSLALGMVEMMARSGGRLESLFLDEGFGSLDPNNLDTAVEALRTVAARGRMVGVISHMPAVAEQVEHVLKVTRHATGSQVKWLSGTQLQDFAESNLGGLLG